MTSKVDDPLLEAATALIVRARQDSRYSEVEHSPTARGAIIRQIADEIAIETGYTAREIAQAAVSLMDPKVKMPTADRRGNSDRSSPRP